MIWASSVMQPVLKKDLGVVIRSFGASYEQ
jgi:hypothetical protein